MASNVLPFIDSFWDAEVLPALKEYITIPNQSPAFDRDWRRHGHMDRAADLIAAWIERQQIPGLKLQTFQLQQRTPLLFIEVPGQSDDTVLLYGHLDKQPPMEPWREGLNPWTPVIEGDRLYGRGSADDGYAAFAATAALVALAREKIPHARCVIVIEACEESGSPDLPVYIDALKEDIGEPSLVICLDSGCGDYERLWVTTSLRGLVSGDLTVSTLTEGVHSGNAGGIVPSSFRIARQILDRVEDSTTGAIKVTALQADIPVERLEQATAAAHILGERVYKEFPFQPGSTPPTSELRELVLNRAWRPQLEVTGAGGLPSLDRAGNVLRPQTTLRLSFRLPPTADPKRAAAELKQVLEADPPYGAKVTFSLDAWGASGWNAPPTVPWLAEAIRRASMQSFGAEACYMGEGGTIPFMAMLGEQFPQAQFLITGVLGPQSNAHGPNEFLHLPTAKKLTACVAHVLAEHGKKAEG